MDEDDFKYAEFIFSILKKRGRSVRKYNLSNYVHSGTQFQNWKRINNYDHIYRFLEELGMIEIIYLTPNNQEISPKELLFKTTSIQELLEKIQKERDEKIRELAQGKEDKDLDRKLKKRQLWLAKNWWLTSGVSLIVGAIIQKLFDFI